MVERPSDQERDRLVAAAFRKEELAYLTTQDSFKDQYKKIRSLDDFMGLCEVGENLLLARE